MNKTLRLHGVAAAVAWLIATGASAQNLTITNARIIDGTGRVIERGAVVVTDGKIASVSATAPAAAAGGRTIDAGGKTVMPGLIDAHRHIVTGDAPTGSTRPRRSRCRSSSTRASRRVLCAIDPPPAIEARNRIEAGQLKGPRLYVGAFHTGRRAARRARRPPAIRRAPIPRAGHCPTSPQPAMPREVTIKAVEDAAKAGYDYLKVVLNTTKNGPELETLKLIVSEGKKHNKPTIVHAVSVRDTLVAIEAKPDLLVHTPHIGNLERRSGRGEEDRRREDSDDVDAVRVRAALRREGHRRSSAIAKPFPWNTLSSAGQGPVNARLLWDAGLVSYGYGTDTQWPPKETLGDELRALRLVFSPQEVVQDHHEERRDRDDARRRDRHARARQARRHRDRRRRPAARQQRAAARRDDDQGRRGRVRGEAMRGTLISILVGALAGVLLTLGSNVHASRAAASRATPVSGVITPAQTAADPVLKPAVPPAALDEQAPLAK